MAKPSNVKGTRDFLPQQMTKRSYIFETIKKIFLKYGYQCIETPSLEKTETLMGKYGEEGDKLIFKVLNNGDYLKGLDLTSSESSITSKISSRALRYDLTVPFARFVTQHRDSLSFPFKRYQIQPVWRADKPQKGRYREFYQCDADVVGSDSLLYEIEQIQIFNEVLSSLGISHTIHINNRKILAGIAEVVGAQDKILDITIALDKLDKIGEEGVKNEWTKRGLSKEIINKLSPLFNTFDDWGEVMTQIKEMLATSEIGLKGIDELEYVFNMTNTEALSLGNLKFNITLARGLNYYTGAIFEVTTDMIKIGSICGGGRYDDLTAMFGMKGTSGVGISFGADRIYDVMEEVNGWPENLEKGVEVFFLNLGNEELKTCLDFQADLRSKGVRCDTYPAAVKMKRQMKYANDTNAQYVAIIGSNEFETKSIKVKNMLSGEEVIYSWESFVVKFEKVLRS